MDWYASVSYALLLGRLKPKSRIRRRSGAVQKVKRKPKPTAIKVCSLCYEKVYPGCRHQCSERNYRRKKVYNLERLTATPTTSERLASRAVNRCSDVMCLSTLSSRKRAMEAKEPLRKTLFSADDMSIIRKYLNLTSRGTLKLVQDLRMVAGSKVRIVCLGEDACHESQIGQFLRAQTITIYS